MKCPKCGYMSFDYNQVCPKCNKDISGEQARLNMPAFRPDPPSLLGILTGEADESNVGLQVDHASMMDASQDMDVNLEDSVVLEESEETGFEEDQGMEISLETDDSGDFELPAEEEIEDTDDMLDLGMDEGEEGISLDADSISSEDTEGDLAAPLEEEDGEGISLDLGDISLEEPEEEIPITEETAQEDGGEEIDLGGLSEDISISPEEGEETALDDSSEIELGLDDLKINETGELEVSQEESAADAEATKLVEELALDDSSEEPEEESLDLGEISLDEDSGDEETTKLVEELALDDSSEEPEEESLDLGDLSLDEADSDDNENTIVYDEPPSADEAGLEDILSDESGPRSSDEDFDLDDIDLDIEGDQERDGSGDEEMSLDLDNLDLDLDLDDSEDK
jgi:hypothetical protein